MPVPHFAALLLVLLSTLAATAQEPSPYSRRNTFSVFTEYSNTSSRILIGADQNRRLIAPGFTYARRLHHSRYTDWNYAIEVRPLTLIREPYYRQATTTVDGSNDWSTPPAQLQRGCVTRTIQYAGVPELGKPAYTVTFECSSRWSYAGGLSPLSQRLNFAPSHHLQPFIAANGGFLVSTHDLPVANSSRFNFTFEFGAGLELFRAHHRSIAAEYRLHHLSNAFTGTYNPGVDNQILKLTYSFGN